MHPVGIDKCSTTHACRIVICQSIKKKVYSLNSERIAENSFGSLIRRDMREMEGKLSLQHGKSGEREFFLVKTFVSTFTVKEVANL